VDENREIVRSENQSLVRDVKTAALFALMDFEKYLGKGVAASILKSRALPENTDAFEKHCAALEAELEAARRQGGVADRRTRN